VPDAKRILLSREWRACPRGDEMEEHAVVDRIEDDTQAVLLVGDSETERVVPAEGLPEGAGPGTWLRVRFDGSELVHCEVDTEQTEGVRSRISQKLDRLRRRGRHGRQQS
jgi:hypothetical protein